eukprot:Hpha_TRINITY_DN7757_c0_g1::TRINITY_DN7757_c0_g1_i1::g.85419::m.85419
MSEAGRVRLTAAEFNHLGEAFTRHVVQTGFGRIDEPWKLRNVLQACGQTPTDDDIARMLPPEKGVVEFNDVVRLLEEEKAKFSRPPPPDSDTIQAFVAMGGGEELDEKGGEVHADLLRRMVHNFNLTLDIEKLIKEVDTDGSGEISFDEFSEMFRTEFPPESSYAGKPSKKKERRQSRGGTMSPNHRPNRPRAYGMAQKAGAAIPARQPTVQYPRQPTNQFASRQVATFLEDDDDSYSSGSAYSVRQGKGAHVAEVPDRQALIVASGARKATGRRATGTDLLEMKLKRVERHLKRPGEIGGEIPAIPGGARRRLRDTGLAKRSRRRPQRAARPLPSEEVSYFGGTPLPRVESPAPSEQSSTGSGLLLQLDPDDPDEEDVHIPTLRAARPPAHWEASSVGLSTSLQARMRQLAGVWSQDSHQRTTPSRAVTVVRQQLSKVRLARPRGAADTGWAYSGLEGADGRLPPGAFSRPGTGHDDHRRLLAHLLAVKENTLPEMLTKRTKLRSQQSSKRLSPHSVFGGHSQRLREQVRAASA